MRGIVRALLVSAAAVVLSVGALSSEPLEFTDVVQVEGATKDELYSRALSWFGETFRSAKEVIQVQDKEAGQIIGKGNFEYESATFICSRAINGFIRFTVKVSVKDGRFKYVVTNFIHEGNEFVQGGAVSFGLLLQDGSCPNSNKDVTKGLREKNCKKLMAEAEANTNRLVTSLKAAMSTAVGGGEDW